MKKKKKILIIFICICAVFVLSFSMYKIDCYRLKQGKTPIFTVLEDGINDGGSTVYYGFLYQLIDWEPMDKDNFEGPEIEMHFIFNFNNF